MGSEFEDDDDIFTNIPDEYLTVSCETLKPESPSEIQVEVPQVFPFPFEPYDIQVALMRRLYETLELGKIGIFESPTGTGKSLSLICGSLTWLRDFEERKLKEVEKSLNNHQAEITTAANSKKEEFDWVMEHIKKKEVEEHTKKLEEECQKRMKIDEKLKQVKGRVQKIAALKRKRATLEEEFEALYKDSADQIKKSLDNDEPASLMNSDDEDDDVLVAEYHSDDDRAESKSVDSDEEITKITAEDSVTKIYYCSRTHSQLSQFVSEVQRSPYSSETRTVCLGSRLNMCINEAVTRLKSLSLINDQCLTLQKNKSGKKKGESDENTQKKRKCTGCPYYRSEAISHFTEEVLVEVRDIEELVSLGKQLKACPYYGTRYAVPSAQLVVLPYNTLLHKSTRESSGIRLSGNIVIIDEGHNLLETISSVHSIEVSGKQLSVARSQLSRYLEKYRSRLKAKNLMYIRQILFILEGVIRLLEGTGTGNEQSTKSKSVSRMVTLNDFLFETKLDNLNLFKVLRYCRRSMIAKKLLGFAEKYQNEPTVKLEEKSNEKSATSKLSTFLKEIVEQQKPFLQPDSGVDTKLNTDNSDNKEIMFMSPLMHIEGFLESLTNADRDGRIVVTRKDDLKMASVKFLLLNPGTQFADIVREARAVIIAGGTMQPIADFKDQLLFTTGTEPERIIEFSCGHVIPGDQLLPIALSHGPTGVELDFTYEHRATHNMMDELGRAILNVCSAVFGGVVIFFPSYDYEKTIYSRWEQTGVLSKISAKKRVFREPKQSNQVDALLQEYSLHIKKQCRLDEASRRQHDGAVLFSVVGGKMSEGINFSDELGRCIIMVGLPYPNIHSPELKEKIDYLNANMPKEPGGRLPGQIHFENLCMKAVNQSIGRAIRHRLDYASILLLDHRYKRSNVVSKLPTWIRDHLQIIDKFGSAFAAIHKFSQTRISGTTSSLS